MDLTGVPTPADPNEVVMIAQSIPLLLAQLERDTLSGNDDDDYETDDGDWWTYEDDAW